MNFLFLQHAKPEYQCRVRWEPGTVALWRNAGTQHYACADYLPACRTMHRVTVLHDRRVAE